MSTMEQRFKRAFQVLENIHIDADYQAMFGIIHENALCLRWLRNEAKLWEDYVQDEEWLINGVDYDPNHPDNLSDAVYRTWKSTKGVY